MGKRWVAVFLVTFIVSCSVSVAAQVIGERIALGDTCSFGGEELPENVILFSSDNEAQQVIRDILKHAGLAQNFQVKAAGVPNAAAVIHGETRYILYNQHFIQETRKRTGNKWAPISIMAHEIGHHLNGHTLSRNGSRPNIELEADYFSGFVLQKMGASMDDARAAMTLIGSPSGSATHPAKHDRLAAITKGWSDAKENQSKVSKAPEKSEIKETPPVKKAPTQTKPDTSRAQVPSQPNQSGFPPGFGMQVCGCWGFNPPNVAPEPRCQSGQVRINQCAGFCPGGGSPYAYVCR